MPINVEAYVIVAKTGKFVTSIYDMEDSVTIKKLYHTSQVARRTKRYFQTYRRKEDKLRVVKVMITEVDKVE